MQIQPTMRYKPGNLIFKGLKTPNVVELVKPPKYSLIVHEDAKWCKHFEKRSDDLAVKLKKHLCCNPTVYS